MTTEFTIELDATQPDELPVCTPDMKVLVRVKERANRSNGWPVVELKGERQAVLEFVELHWGTEAREDAENEGGK